MLLAAIAPTSVAANGLSTFLILTTLDGFIEVLWANCTTLELLPTLGILFGIAAVANAFSIWRFNHGQIFE
ncbi:MAG: hypothetical protein H0W66_06660 [Chthoniobacterales bacterium]|nr:hypothetical protein [Chthoniobacterales bacterium]